MESDYQEELRAAIREETARGTRRRIPDADVVAERLARLQLMKELLRIGDKSLFLKTLSDYGLQVGSEEYNLALQAWNEYHPK